MSIASRITSIEGHISDIYDSVELTGVDTTDIDKNLVNVPNTLKEGYIDIINNGTDTLYNNFPKVSGEGTSLTLNNTYQAPMRNNLKGNTSQTGTPTPTSPIPVNVVSGDNEILVNGKNLIIPINNGTQSGITFTTDDNGITTINGTSTGSFERYVIIKKLIPAGTYTFSVQVIGEVPENSSQIILRNNSGINIAIINLWNTTPKVITLEEDTIIGSYYFYANRNTTFNQVKLAVQLEIGSSATSYEPYQGNTYNIDLPVENLFDKDTTNIINGYISTTGFNAYANNRTIYIPTKVGQTYTIQKTVGSGNLLYAFTENTPAIGTQTLLGRTDASSKTATVTAPTNGNYLAITMYRDADSSFTVDEVLGGLQIEKGPKANKYTPYGTTPIELCKIGNYQDYFYKDSGKWYLHKEIGKVVLDGSENWGVGVYGTNSYNLAKSDMLYTNNNIVVILSNLFKGVAYNDRATGGNDIVYPDVNESTIYIRNTSYVSLANFKTMLGTTNLVSYYVLATPTNTEITDTTLINQLEQFYQAQSKNNQTNISQVNNDLPFIISASALKKG